MRHGFLAAAWLLWFLAHGVRISIAPVLPLIKAEFGLTNVEAGRLPVFVAAGYVAMVIGTAFLGHRVGYRRLVLWALFGLALLLVLMGFAPGLASFSLLLLGLGLATGTVLPSVLPLLTEAYGRPQWGRSLSFFDSAAPVGQLAAPLLALGILSAFPWRSVFFAFAVLGLLVLFLFARTAPRGSPQKAGPKGAVGPLFRNRSLVLLAFVWWFASSAGIGLGYLLPLYLVNERGMSLSAANAWFAGSRGTGFAAMVLVGFLTNRYTCRDLLGSVLVLTGLFQLGIALWPEGTGAGVFVLLQGGVVNAFFPVGLLAIARLTEGKQRGSATGFIIGAGTALGFGVTPWALGALADALDFRTGIALLGALTLASALVTRRIERV